MKSYAMQSRAVIYLIIAGIAVPQVGVGIEQTAPTGVLVVRDVELDSQGSLRGKLLDSNGKPIPNAPVQVKQNNQVTAQTKTDASGSFVARDVRPGLCEVAAAQSSGIYRVWTHNAAPPSATVAVLLLDQGDVVRGQGSNLRQLMIVTGLAISAGLVGGIIGYNLHNDDDDAS